MKILHVIDSFEVRYNARQLQILGPALQSDKTTVEICCLGPDTHRLEMLRTSGIVTHALHWTRWFDAHGILELRAVLRESAPDVIHVWGLSALRTLTLCAADYLSRVVVSGEVGKLAWWDKRLLQHVGSSSIPPAIDTEKPISDSRREGPIQIACLEPSFRHAIWTFDFVRLLFPDATLHLVGAGAESAALTDMAHGLQCSSSVYFHEDIATVLPEATVVWVPSLTNRGQQAALEAMAMGCPVVASGVPCLRDVIEDGETGCLIAPGDVVQLARRTRILLDDGPMRIRMGVAARELVLQQFSLPRTVECWRDVYRRFAA